ncbi:MAG: arsenate reductase ArsC [Candidatus Eisenbacteria bacterium]
MTAPLVPAAFISRPPAKILFLCLHNSSRSQMAEGFARALAPASVTVMSAGTEPRGVNPHAVTAMQEVGIDLSAHTSKHIDEVPWREADTVITLCGEGAEVCPQVAGDVRRVHWPLPDPSAPNTLEAFRAVRDEIRWRVASFWPRRD